MGLRGKLTLENMAPAMPIDAPAYREKPFHFRGARMCRLDYETDAEAAAALTPAQLTLTDPVSASLWFCEYPWSSVGPYREAILSVDVLYGDEPFFYLSHLILDSEIPIQVGREMYGIPKKMGAIEFTQEGDVRAGYVERPEGIRICSAVFRTETPLDSPPDGTPWRIITLRAIPSPEKDKDHSLVELIQTDIILSSMEMWAGNGSCHFPGISTFDPWHKLPVRKMLNMTYMVTDAVLEESKILETL